MKKYASIGQDRVGPPLGMRSRQGNMPRWDAESLWKEHYTGLHNIREKLHLHNFVTKKYCPDRANVLYEHFSFSVRAVYINS